MKLAVIGLGIGEVHARQAKKLGIKVYTVDQDSAKNADYLTVDGLLEDHPKLKAAIICTPNFTHEDLIRKLVPACKLVMVEKPGLENAKKWLDVVTAFPKTKIVMCSNNLFRKEIKLWQKWFKKSDVVNILWLNKNRVPFPGFWFTNKKLAFGGVSYDLGVHLIHILIAMAGFDSVNDPTSSIKAQNWNLNTIKDTDYGTVNTKDPVYDVDDYCQFKFDTCGKDIKLETTWKNNVRNQIEIQFLGKKSKTVELGLCPESAYRRQLKFFLSMSKAEYDAKVELDCFVLNCLESA